MQAGRVLLGSAVLHVAALALVARWLDRPPAVVIGAPPAAMEVTIEAPRVEPAPIDVAILDTPPAIATVGSTRATPHGTPLPRGTAATSALPSGAATEPATGPGRDRAGGPGHGLMHMRGPELHPGDAQLESIANAGQPLAPRAHETGRVENAPNGKAVIHDAVTTVRIDRDGTAHLDDKPDIEVHWRLPIRPWEWRQDLRDAGKELAEWAADPNAQTRYGRTQDLPAHLRAVEGSCDSFGDPMCDDPLAPGADERARKYETKHGGGVPIFGGKLDITGWLGHKFGIDVYASRKLELLDATRDERVARGDKYRTAQLARSAELMRRNLVALWAATEDLDERRAALFEMWDECAEGDGPVGEAGQRARVEVIGWIRAKLPAGAYSPADLDTLDRRRASKQHFAPY